MKIIKTSLVLIAIVLFLLATLEMNGASSATPKKPLSANSKRVLVEMDIPTLANLTAASTAFKTGMHSRRSSQFSLDADMALNEAITNKRDEVLQTLNGTRYSVNRSYATIPVVALSCSPEALTRLQQAPGVKRVIEDRAFPLPQVTPNLSVPSANPDITTLEQSTQIVGANIAWSYGYTGRGWYVAILDSGIRRTHQMFRGKQIVEHCFSSGENYEDGTRGDCPNGRDEMSGVGSASPYQPRFAHGTHVAGIAAGNDGNTHFGVAKDADIIAVQVFSYFRDDDEVYAWDADILKGLEYIYQLRTTYPIAAVNLSLGGGFFSDYCQDSFATDIIANLKEAGIATIVASGNEAYCGGVGDPACVPGAVVVSATNKFDHESWFGNSSNTLVSLLAPGENINSSVSTSDSSYEYYDGTSMSTPHVTGAWAILKSFNAGLSIDEILTAFKDTGTIIYNTHCNGNSPKPRINIGDAISSLIRVAPPINISSVQVNNRAFLQKEYINMLTWEDNPRNASRTIAHYRIYQLIGEQEILIAEVPASVHTYWVRHAAYRTNTTYTFSAVESNGNESNHFFHTISF